VNKKKAEKADHKNFAKADIVVAFTTNIVQQSNMARNGDSTGIYLLQVGQNFNGSN
jgi:hypothetical protein